jgi:hypothetical protein
MSLGKQTNAKDTAGQVTCLNQAGHARACSSQETSSKYDARDRI